MRDSNYSFPTQNRVCVSITAQLYDRRALDTSAVLPLLNSLTHLTYLTSTSPRIREILTVDGGLERLLEILVESSLPQQLPTYDDWWALKGPSTACILTPSQQNILKHSLAFQCVVNIGVRGSEAIRTRVVQSGTLDVVAQIMEVWLRSHGMSIASGPLGSQAAVARAAAMQASAVHSSSSSASRSIAAQASAASAGANAVKEEDTATRGRERPPPAPPSDERILATAPSAPVRRPSRSWWPASLLRGGQAQPQTDPTTTTMISTQTTAAAVAPTTATSPTSATGQMSRSTSHSTMRQQLQAAAEPQDAVTDTEAIEHVLTAGQRREISLIRTYARLEGIQLEALWRAYETRAPGCQHIVDNLRDVFGLDIRALDALYGDNNDSLPGPSGWQRPQGSSSSSDLFLPSRAAAASSRGSRSTGVAPPPVASIDPLAPAASPSSSLQSHGTSSTFQHFASHFEPTNVGVVDRAMSIDPPPVRLPSVPQRATSATQPPSQSGDDVQMEIDEYIERDPETASMDTNGSEEGQMTRRGTITAHDHRRTAHILDPTPRPPSAPLPAAATATGINVPPRNPRGNSAGAISASSSIPGSHRFNEINLSDTNLAQSLSSTTSEVSSVDENETGAPHAPTARASSREPGGGRRRHPIADPSHHGGFDSTERSTLSTPVNTPPPAQTGFQQRQIARATQLNAETVRPEPRAFPASDSQGSLSQQGSRPLSRAGTEDDESTGGADPGEGGGAAQDGQDNVTVNIVGNQEDNAVEAALGGLIDQDDEAQAQAQVDLAMGAPPGAPGAALTTPRLAEMTPRQAIQTMGPPPPSPEPGTVPLRAVMPVAPNAPANPAIPANPEREPFVVIAAGAPRGFHDLNNLVNMMEHTAASIETTYNDDTILLCLQLLAYLSKYPHVRAAFHHPRRPMHPEVDLPVDAILPERPQLSSSTNMFSLVERFTFRPVPPDREMRTLPKDIQYWAGVIMRNACRKDESHGGIRQCAHMSCGKWEKFPREFAKCRRCRKAKYCSKECQSKAWQEGHRFWCNAREPEPTDSVTGTLIIQTGGSSREARIARELRDRERARQAAAARPFRPPNREIRDAMEADPRMRVVPRHRNENQ